MFRSAFIAVVLMVMISLFVMSVEAAEVHVYVSESIGSDIPANGDMGSPYASIGYAVSQNPGTSGDQVTIHVGAGIYYENLQLSDYQSLWGGYNADFSGRNLADLNDPEYMTIIDGANSDRVIAMGGAEDTTRSVTGFSIRNGSSSSLGGGIFGMASDATISYNKIYGNFSISSGGGIDSCYGIIEYNDIYENTSMANGGGISNSPAEIRHCNIYNNRSYGSGGGGIYNADSGPISDCRIFNNYTSGAGGGLYNCSASIIDCEIYDNHSSSGGGGLSHCSTQVSWSVIYNNDSSENGGGLSDCDGAIDNCLVYNNQANERGGGMYECDGYVYNNTIFGNNADLDGGGLRSCEGQVANCIIWGNTLSGVPGNIGTSVPNLMYCCIEGWSSGGTGNFADDPGLVQPEIGQLHLRTGSACIDSGMNTGLAEDMDGEARPYNGIYDVGADEWTGVDTTAPVFSDFPRRYVPRNEGVYLEWLPGTDTGEPITYLFYSSLVFGSPTFTDPVAKTINTGVEVPLLSGSMAHYLVLRAEDCYGNETTGTSQTTYYSEENMIGASVYNADFEAVPPGSSGKRGMPPPPIEGWTASSQDYGDKTSLIGAYADYPYEGSQCAVIETYGTPVNPDDLSIASLVADNSVALVKDHTYAVSAAVRRTDSQWTRFILFSSGFSIIHTESIDALDDQYGDTGWEMLYFHFRAPSNINAYVRVDSIVSNKRTAGGVSCDLAVDDIHIVDMGLEDLIDIYNVTPPPPQYGIRNRYFDLSTETEVSTIGGTVYSSTDMPKRWNMSMAVDSGSNNAVGYPVWGQETPPSLADTTGEAGYIKARAMDTSGPAWPALAADGVNINVTSSNGMNHVLTFDYGAAGATRPLLRAFMISNDFSHYSSLFVDPSVGIPGNRMWPLTLHYTPAFGDSLILVRFDNVTLGAAGGGPHTDEAAMYIDNVKVNTVND